MQWLALAPGGARRQLNGADKGPVFAPMLDDSSAHKVLRLLIERVGEAGWYLVETVGVDGVRRTSSKRRRAW